MLVKNTTRQLQISTSLESLQGLLSEMSYEEGEEVASSGTFMYSRYISAEANSAQVASNPQQASVLSQVVLASGEIQQHSLPSAASRHASATADANADAGATLWLLNTFTAYIVS